MRPPSEKRSNRRDSGRNSNPRLINLAAAFALFVVLTSAALMQSDDPAVQFRPWSDLSKWLAPIKLNPGADRLAVEGTINAVTSVPGTGQVWAVGNGGLILHSADWGWTWTQQNPPASPGSPVAGPKRAWLSLPVVRAFEKPPEKRPEPLQTDALQQKNSEPVNKGLGQQYPNQAQRKIYIPPVQKNIPPVIPRVTQAPSIAQADLTDDLIQIRMSDTKHGSATGRYNSELVTSDGGQTWQFKNRTRTKRLLTPFDSGNRVTLRTPTRAVLRTLHYEPGRRRGWAAGDNGVILHTDDGGSTWMPQTRIPEQQGITCTRVPAPWYFLLTFPLVGLLLLRANKPLPPREERQMVEGVLTSDAPLDAKSPDTMNFGKMARGLSRFIRHEKTTPPLTIAIDGEWGSGKSSLMNLLRADLERFDFRPVWFNAWHHQGEEHLLAALLESIRSEATPPWWRPDNWAFRLRLLRIRGVRNWLPVLLLICILSGLTATLLLRGGDQTAIQNLMDHIRNLDFTKAIEYLPKSTPTLAFLATALSIVAAFWRGLTAFGVSPAKMLASVSSNARMRDLRVQTGFRQKFAQEFRDVTDALGARSLIIFIDDIDRCSPQNVLTVLEAINFLVSSGGCFIVIGMARAMVERAVGLQFAAVAEEMADDGIDHPTRDQRRERRLRFARQYLDKLINIEIPLPEPTGQQARRLLLERKPVGSPPSLVAGVFEWMRATGRQLAPLLLAAASVLTGVWLGNYLAPAGNQGRNPTAAISSTPPAEATTPQTRGSEDLRNIAVSPAPKLTKPAEPSDVAKWLMVIGGALLAGFAVWKLREPPGLIVHDSREFQEALDAWCDVVRARQNTPRSLKRFMNRVRYLAMRQMPPDPRDPHHPPEEETPESMRESMLVALSALHYVNPSLLIRVNELKAAPDDAIGRAVAEHMRDQFPWPPSAADLELFYSVLPSIRTNDTRSKASGAV
jgi:hypothetical protein